MGRAQHFLHLKRIRQATKIFGNKLLSAKEYLNGYLQSPKKFRQDYSSLLVLVSDHVERLILKFMLNITFCE
ncbi:hypothetical protein NHP190012_07860 [Helicobacter sp. NHP19-012]|uniref:Uncharacterized protein n=1 Tax=Helicobacter gastrofelis TaxID=2849642 RepID=A0ABM7SLZ1_9HELI|nr:hypothetical protein NHP190012_07860 [Helicobacter sp. NHP19-012]GMB96637.1 hypothetical protein NHP22001_12260 [Helicobacter sp. NHP22-001]